MNGHVVFKILGGTANLGAPFTNSFDLEMGIKRIAKLANVSIGTVDRVLNKRAGVSKETEKRVLKIIKETGYVKTPPQVGLN